MNYRSSSQAFKFDILTVLKYCEITSALGELDVRGLGNATGENIPKVSETIQYLRFCDLIHNDKLSSFGLYILKLKKFPEFLKLKYI